MLPDPRHRSGEGPVRSCWSMCSLGEVGRTFWHAHLAGHLDSWLLAPEEQV